jgi:hypothetical protein
MFQRFLGPYVESNPALEMGFVKIGLATEGRRGEDGSVTESRAGEDGSVNESRAGEVSQATESRVGEVGPITEFRAAEIGGTTEGRANEFGPLTERRSIETGPFTDDSAGEVRIVPEGSPEKEGTARREDNGASSPFFSDVTPRHLQFEKSAPSPNSNPSKLI